MYQIIEVTQTSVITLAISGSLILDTPKDFMLKADTNNGIPLLWICAVLDLIDDVVNMIYNNT